MEDICITAPTIRNPSFVRNYVENAREHGFETDRLFFLLVTEDFCDTEEMRAMLADLDVEGAVFGATERQEWFESAGLEAYADIVPAASHAETSFGLLWQHAHDEYEYGMFLDDDTAPHPDFDFFGSHVERLESYPTVEHVSSDENWVNVLYQNADEHGLYPRGYPYSCMDETVRTTEGEAEEVIACQGLWTNIPDLDAVRILMDGNLEGQAETLTDRDDFTGDFVAKSGNYLTVCSMNLSFKREVIPAFYQFPMDDNDWNIGRFDDIWSGLTLKKAADMLGKSIISGYPLCVHNKAKRSTFSDLNNEVPALELNEHFWKALETAPDEAVTYAEAYGRMIEAIEAYDFSEYANAGFIPFMLEKMRRWLDACRAVKEM